MRCPMAWPRGGSAFCGGGGDADVASQCRRQANTGEKGTGTTPSPLRPELPGAAAAHLHGLGVWRLLAADVAPAGAREGRAGTLVLLPRIIAWVACAGRRLARRVTAGTPGQSACMGCAAPPRPSCPQQRHAGQRCRASLVLGVPRCAALAVGKAGLAAAGVLQRRLGLGRELGGGVLGWLGLAHRAAAVCAGERGPLASGCCRRLGGWECGSLGLAGCQEELHCSEERPGRGRPAAARKCGAVKCGQAEKMVGMAGDERRCAGGAMHAWGQPPPPKGARCHRQSRCRRTLAARIASCADPLNVHSTASPAAHVVARCL